MATRSGARWRKSCATSRSSPTRIARPWLSISNRCRGRARNRKLESMNIFVGIALQLGATFSFTVMGALVRYVGGRVPLGEQVFTRSFFALIPLVAMLLWRNQLASAFRTKNPFGHVPRGVSGVIAMVCMFAALARLPLVDATAIGFATPLINVALAAIFLGEKVHVFRWSAVAVGFLGVLVMLSPHLFGAEREA